MKKLALIAFTANSTQISLMLQGKKEFNEGPLFQELLGNNPVICELSLYEMLKQKNIAPAIKKVVLCEDLLCDPDDEAIVCRSIWSSLEHTDRPDEKGDTIFFLCNNEKILGEVLNRFKFVEVYTVHSIEPNAKTHQCVF